MENINIFKIVLDIVMCVLLVLLYNKLAVTGLEFHEIAGIVIIVFFAVHIIVNFKWVKQVTLKFFTNKVNFRTRLSYVVNLLLFISMLFILISGISISKVVFPNVRLLGERGYKGLHAAVSYISHILVGIHVGLNWNWVMVVFKKMFNISRKSVFLKAASLILTTIILIFGVYKAYSIDYFSKLSPIAEHIGGSENGGPLHGNGIGKARKEEYGEENIEDVSRNESANDLDIIATYLSILSVFAIITYYIDKTFRHKIVIKNNG